MFEKRIWLLCCYFSRLRCGISVYGESKLVPEVQHVRDSPPQLIHGASKGSGLCPQRHGDSGEDSQTQSHPARLHQPTSHACLTQACSRSPPDSPAPSSGPNQPASSALRVTKQPNLDEPRWKKKADSALMLHSVINGWCAATWDLPEHHSFIQPRRTLLFPDFLQKHHSFTTLTLPGSSSIHPSIYHLSIHMKSFFLFVVLTLMLRVHQCPGTTGDFNHSPQRPRHPLDFKQAWFFYPVQIRKLN